MPSLHETQRCFAAALLSDDSTLIEPHVRATAMEPHARIRIYRNNAREIHRATLRATFPVIERLAGEDYFRQLALEYRERFPSTSGNLHHLGERFPEFLARHFVDVRYRYFVDVARLEWAYQEAMIAPDHAPFDIHRLRAIAPSEYASLVFKLHPAARLVASTFPILAIWSANQAGGDAGQTIDLDSGGENVLVLRARHDVELRRLETGDSLFLKQVADGAVLAEAAAAAGDAGEFDLGATLRRYVAAGALVDFSLSASTSRPEPGSPA